MDDPNEREDEKGKRLRDSSSLRKLCVRGISSIGRFKRRRNFSSVFLYLPTELLWKVFSFLDTASLCSSSFVSVGWYGVANDTTLWRAIYQRDYQVTCVPKEGQKDWKRHYFLVAEKFSKISVEINAHPEDLNNYVMRAQQHMEFSHYKAACEDLTFAIEHKQEFPNKNPDTSLGLLLLRRALNYRHMGEAERAQQDVSMAIQLEPDSAHFYRIRGNWRREDNDLDGALEDYCTAIDLQPGIAVHYFCRGLVYKEQKNFVLAIHNLDTAIQLEPDNANFRCSRGRMHSQLGAYEEAMKDLDHAVKVDPTNSDYLHWRGRVHRESQECEKAVKDFEQALSLTKDDIDYAWCSIMYSQMKNNVKAQQYIDKAISLAPDNSFHHQFKGILNFGLGNFKTGLESFNLAIKLFPKWSGHYVWRAAVYHELGEPHSSIEDLDMAVHLKPDDISLFWRGLYHLGMRHFTKAKYDLLAAMREAEAPPHSRIPFWLGVVLFLLGDHKEASDLWERTIQTAKSERRVAHYNEPARVELLVNRDERAAKAHYSRFFQAHYTIDNTKTENTHLDLLASLFPENQAIKNVRQWFQAERERLYESSHENLMKRVESVSDGGESEKKQYHGIIMGK